MIITAPIYDFDGKFVGVVALEKNMDSIYEFIQDTTGLGETGETLIGQFMKAYSEGDVAVHDGQENYNYDHILFLNPLRHDKEAALKRTVSFDDEHAIAIQNAVKGMDGSGASIGYRNLPILAAWRNIPSLGWGLVAKMDSDEVFAPIMNLRNTLIVMSFILLLLVFIVAFWISGKITNPIHKLATASDDIARGKLDVEIEKSKRKDEIGLLINSFREMAGSLRDKKRKRRNLLPLLLIN